MFRTMNARCGGHRGIGATRCMLHLATIVSVMAGLGCTHLKPPHPGETLPLTVAGSQADEVLTLTVSSGSFGENGIAVQAGPGGELLAVIVDLDFRETRDGKLLMEEVARQEPAVLIETELPRQDLQVSLLPPENGFETIVTRVWGSFQGKTIASFSLPPIQVVDNGFSGSFGPDSFTAGDLARTPTWCSCGGKSCGCADCGKSFLCNCITCGLTCLTSPG